MRTLAILIAVILSAACSDLSTVSNAQSSSSQPASNSDAVWSKILDQGPWPKSYNFQMFSIGGKLWVLHPEGNWSSADGKTWTKSTLNDAIGNLAFLDYVYFKGALYGIGNFRGNIERYELKPEIYRTTDFKKWETLSKNSDLPQRFFYHPFVFNEKLWMIGGEDKKTKYSDIWNSDDAITWKKQREGLPFGKRSGSQVVELNGKLYLLENDVWTSNDGLDWKQVTPEIVKGEPIFGYTAVVFDGKIWLLGCNRNGRFSSQILVSRDGQNWEAQSAPWTPRGGIAAAVHDGKIYLTGGKYGGTPDMPNFIYSNDIWTLTTVEVSK